MPAIYDVIICREHAFARDRIKAATPQAALAVIQRNIIGDDNFDYEHYDSIGGLQSITIERDGHELIEYIEPCERLRQHAQELLDAAEAVVRNWEQGDLAAAVRELDAVAANAKGSAA